MMHIKYYKYIASTLLLFSFAVTQTGCSPWPQNEIMTRPVFVTPAPTPIAHPQGLSAKKREFIGFLHPHIVQANAEVQKERSQLLSLQAIFQEKWTLGLDQEQWLRSLAANYKLNGFDMRNHAHWLELKKRVDIVPAPLALAQAASESGWGTSRFAQEGNNYFGQWCFTFSCGMVPKLRAKGAKHEVKRFASAYESVLAYVRNLNSNQAYRAVRDIRWQMRNQGKDPAGHVLADGLLKYSSRGKAYVNEVRALIKRNQLENYGS